MTDIERTVQDLYNTFDRPCSTHTEAIKALTYLEHYLPADKFKAFMDSFKRTNAHGADVIVALWKKRGEFNTLDRHLKSCLLSPPYHNLVFYKDCDEVKEMLQRAYCSDMSEYGENAEDLRVVASIVLGHTV